MHDKEAAEMMNRCVSEITSLRRQIDTLAPKADAYDSITTILRLLPRPSQGYGEDLVWALKKRIDELAKAETNPVSPTPTEGE